MKVRVQQFIQSKLRHSNAPSVKKLKEVRENVELALMLNSKSALSEAYCQLSKIIKNMEGK